MTKQEIRSQIKQLINENKKELGALSNRICSWVFASQEFLESKIVFAYIPLDDEVNVLPVIEAALANGKEVAVPRIISGTNKMDFYYIKNVSQDLVPGSFNILEPKDNLTLVNPLQITDSALILCPGRGFTKEGHRLGRGKGFYDIYFEQLINKSNFNFCGICFPFQILENIPVTENDIRMKKVFC